MRLKQGGEILAGPRNVRAFSDRCADNERQDANRQGHPRTGIRCWAISP
jgi:hypothetical protein